MRLRHRAIDDNVGAFQVENTDIVPQNPGWATQPWMATQRAMLTFQRLPATSAFQYFLKGLRHGPMTRRALKVGRSEDGRGGVGVREAVASPAKATAQGGCDRLRVARARRSGIGG